MKPIESTVLINIDKAGQKMTVFVDGRATILSGQSQLFCQDTQRLRELTPPGL